MIVGALDAQATMRAPEPASGDANGPTGLWWLAASVDQKMGFLTGEEACYVKKVAKGAFVDEPGITASFGENFYVKIDQHILSNNKKDYPLILSIHDIMTYHYVASANDIADKLNGYSPGDGRGIAWASYSYKFRINYIYGYSVCSSYYLRKKLYGSIRIIEERVSNYYNLEDKYSTDERDFGNKSRLNSKRIDELINYWPGLRAVKTAAPGA
ncbi:hypothetical protein [Novosphingobium sp. AAP93]|uniref:hypothetical protein n=1 Tax=Novosphingobium sp. AAP93 TaxID=1523427 RepID=UPI001E4D84F9|nr:hypothetical protein [Novosphingobium sp. AAP93]